MLKISCRNHLLHPFILVISVFRAFEIGLLKSCPCLDSHGNPDKVIFYLSPRISAFFFFVSFSHRLVNRPHIGIPFFWREFPFPAAEVVCLILSASPLQVQPRPNLLRHFSRSVSLTLNFRPRNHTGPLSMCQIIHPSHLHSILSHYTDSAFHPSPPLAVVANTRL